MSGFTPPDATCVIGGAASGPTAATTTIAATTMSTGMTSTVPSGTPGNWLSNPLAYDRITGSAIRNPRIQPGTGSAHADSMIDGRTIETGTSPLLSVTACSPSALVNAYASGQPTLAARARPASTSWSLTQRSRSCSVLAASAGAPAAPSSARASLRNRARCSGWRLMASVSPFSRRAAATSSRHESPMSNGPSLTSSSGALPRRLPAT